MANNPFAAIVGQRRAQSLLSRGTKQNIPLGPWPKGLYDSPSYLGTDGTQLDRVPEGAASALLNFEINPDGSVEARRGIVEVQSTISPSNSAGNLLGVIDFNFNKYGIFAIDRGASGAGSTFYLIDPNTPFSLGSIVQQSTLFYRVVIEYNNTIYLIPLTTGDGKSTVSTVTTVPWVLANQVNIPGGQFALIIRDRMFVINSQTGRVYWSKATDPTIWAAPDGGFVDVNPNDGGNINSVVYDNTNLYIFKDTGIWLFSFTSDPAVDGYLRKVSVTTVRQAYYYNGIIYCLTIDGLYILKGSSLVKISHQVNLSASLDANSIMARINKLLLITTSANTYIYDTELNCWFVWVIKANGWQNTNRTIFDSSYKSIELSTATGVRYTILPTSRNAINNASFLILPSERVRQTSYPGTIYTLDLYNNSVIANSGFWQSPEYHLQTRRLRLIPQRFIKIFGVMFDWSYVRDTGGILPASATCKILRTLTTGEVPTVFYTGLTTGRGQEIKGLGPVFTVLSTGQYDVNYLAFASMVRGTASDVGSHNFRTMSIVAQFKLLSAVDLTGTTLSPVRSGTPAQFAGQAIAVPDVTIRNIFVEAAGPLGEFNDQVAI